MRRIIPVLWTVACAAACNADDPGDGTGARTTDPGNANLPHGGDSRDAAPGAAAGGDPANEDAGGGTPPTGAGGGTPPSDAGAPPADGGAPAPDGGTQPASWDSLCTGGVSLVGAKTIHGGPIFCEGYYNNTGELPPGVVSEPENGAPFTFGHPCAEGGFPDRGYFFDRTYEIRESGVYCQEKRTYPKDRTVPEQFWCPQAPSTLGRSCKDDWVPYFLPDGGPPQ